MPIRKSAKFASLCAAALSLLSCEGAPLPSRRFFPLTLDELPSLGGSGQDTNPSPHTPPDPFGVAGSQSGGAHGVSLIGPQPLGAPGTSPTHLDGKDLPSDLLSSATVVSSRVFPEIPEYRDEYMFAPVRHQPSRSENLFDAATGILYDSDRLFTLTAKHGARLLRKYEMPRDDEAVTSGIDSLISPARLRLFGRDSGLYPLRLDLRPRGIDAVDDFDVRFKIQWIVNEPSEFSKTFHYIGCSVDTGWSEGDIFVVYQAISF